MACGVMIVRFDVLGPVRVTVGTDAVPLAGRLRLGLLALLLVRANTPVPGEALLDALWDDRCDRNRLQRLHTNVHKLRKALDEPERLTFDSGNYLLRVNAGELDADRFDDLLARAGTTDDAACRVELLRTALELWRGEPFQGLDFGELVAHSQRLIERKQAALEEFYIAELECGRHAAAVADLTELVRAHPLRERLYALLMAALYRSGRQADALATYQQARRTLVNELGLEPGPELRAAERQILAGETCALGRPAASPVRPVQLPPAPRDFVGRRTELTMLDRLSAAKDDPMPVVAVTGTAGVGKTALVAHWAQRARERFPDGQLYVDLQGFSPTDPLPATVALGGFLRALGQDSAAIPADVVERSARFRTLTSGRRVLVVLDNAATAEQVRPLLPGGTSGFVVITSRDALRGLTAGEGVHSLDVAPMTRAEGHALLHTRVGHARIAEEPAARLIEHCAGLPLAVRIAAERLRPSGRDITDLVTELDVEQGRLDLFETGDEFTSIRAVLSWSYRQLTPDAARLFRLCGFRCPHPRHSLDAYGASALLDTDDVRWARRLLDELVRHRLLDATPDGRYPMHILLQAYAAELADATENRADAQLRLLGHYVTTALHATTFLQQREIEPRSGDAFCGSTPAFTDSASALRWLDAQRPSLACTAEFAPALGRPAYTIDLSTVLWPYLDNGRHLEEARHIHALARAAARELDDRTAEGIAVRALGVVELRLERYDAAEALLDRALALHAADEDAALRATTMTYVATVRAATDRVDDAIRLG